MGEAKRRNQQAGQIEGALRTRVRQGDFGAPGTPLSCCVVVDKTARGKDLLAVLRSTDALAPLRSLCEGEDLQLWQASPLFRYAVLCGGTAVPKARTLLAADLDRLLHVTLPQALALLPFPRGTVVAVDEAVQVQIEARAESLGRT